MLGRSTRNRIVGVSTISILVLTLYACGSDTGVSPEATGPEEHQVDVGGATVIAQNGGVSLTIPPGAVSGATTITVSRVLAEPVDSSLVPGTLYDFGPNGLQFSSPVTLRLSFDPTAIPGQATAEDLGIFKRSGTEWLATANGSVDVLSATVTGEINSFSQYAVVVASLQPLVVSTTALPFGVENVDYGALNPTTLSHVTATGGDQPYTWTVADGALVAGLTLRDNGFITGTPTATGTTNLTVEVASADGQTAQQALSITVNPQPVLAPSELCTDFPGYAVPTFEDASLDAAVRAALTALGLGEQPSVNCADASGVQFLLGTGAGITSLVGIQNLPNVLELSLDDNSITDISLLATLSRLRAVRLQSNSLTDLSALSGLGGLTELSLGNNSITDVSPLAGLTSLISLSLPDNSITDVSPLSGLTTSLTFLDLSNNLVRDIDPLGGLASVRELILDDNRISSFGGGGVLDGMTSLIGLHLARNLIDGEPFDPLTPYRSPIGGLQTLTGLQYIDLEGTPIGSFEPLLAFEPLLNNSGLGEGDTVVLLSTGVHCSVVWDLRAKGVVVISEHNQAADCLALPPS